jgi:hypothetical protein
MAKSKIKLHPVTLKIKGEELVVFSTSEKISEKTCSISYIEMMDNIKNGVSKVHENARFKGLSEFTKSLVV